MEKTVPELYGSMVFNDSVMRERLPREVYRSLRQTMLTGQTLDISIADTVAAVMKDWAIEKGATHYTHWFQPLTSVTAEKHDAFLTPVAGDKVVMELSGKSLIQGESDASSFPSGGLRATCAARGYTAWDPSSYAFVRDRTLYIPTAFCSYTGESLDYKTPLMRSMQAISDETLRLLRIFGDTETKRVVPTVGAEQEYFLVSKELYDQREDLLFTGRTLFGAPAPKGQEMEDHYFGAIKPKISEFMHELDEELWKLGIQALTKHNEVAPAQHELAPRFVTTNLAVDQNLLTMEIMKATALRHGMKCLLHEKPFAGINGSGKHNNWSIATDTGVNLLSPGKNPVENTRFLLLFAGIVQAIDEYQDLLRISVASCGNDLRLGASEAPPAIVSMFVGEELEEIIDSIVGDHAYVKRAGGNMDLGISSVPVFEKDTTDRNRTSPFAFTGNKFEFRMVGASQNIAMCNVILNTAVARVFGEFADEIEAAPEKQSAIATVIKRALTEHRRILFGGDGYTEDWKEEAKRRGLSNLATSVEAFRHFTDEKNVALFTGSGVLSASEMGARQGILFENYAKIVRVEARTMVKMTLDTYYPAVERYLGELANTVKLKREVCGDAVSTAIETDLISKLSALSEEACRNALDLRQVISVGTPAPGDWEEEAERLAREAIPMMGRLRATVDAMEVLCAKDLWPVPSYGELLFKQC